MAKRKLFRRKIKQPDEFQTTTERVVEYVQENPIRTAMIAGAVAAILLVVWGAGWFVEYRRDKILRLEGEAMALYQAAGEDKTKVPEAARKLEAVYNEYPGTASGQICLYYAANLHFAGGDFGKALEKFRLLSGTHPENKLLYPLALRNMAYAKEQTGDLQGALADFEKLKGLPGDLPRAQLLWDLAAIHEKLGSKEKATASYQEIINSHKDSQWAAAAREKLGLPPEKTEEK